MKIDEMLDQLETLGERRTPRMIWKSVLFYYGAILLNRYNVRKNIDPDEKYEKINYYGIIFAPSAIGKSYTIKQIEKMCHLETYKISMMNTYMHIYTNNSQERIPREEHQQNLYYMPSSVTVGIDGTPEGLFKTIQSQVASGFGSINLQSDEWLDNLSTSKEMISKLKQIYDGKLQAKIIKGDTEQVKDVDIEGIICNFIGLGSRDSGAKEMYDSLMQLVSTGLFRRSFIIDMQPKIERNTDKADVKELKKHLSSLVQEYQEKTMKMKDEDVYAVNILPIDSEAIDFVEKINDELIERANENMIDRFEQYNVGSTNIIIDLAYIIAFLEGDTMVMKEHMEYAYEFFKETRETIQDTFTPKRSYRLIYDILHKTKNPMTITEMHEYESLINTSQMKVAEDIALVDELCYRNGEELHIQRLGEKKNIGKYKIEPLPKNELNQLIISVNNRVEGPKATSFINTETDWETLQKLVKSEKIFSFTACHYLPKNKNAPEMDEAGEVGYRSKDNFVQGQNLVIFDIDDGLSIKEAQELLDNYTYLIYTTKSHQIDKNGSGKCDRFRIIMPTETLYNVNPEQHKQMYINIEKILNLTANDAQTRNVSRLFYTNPHAEIYINEKALLDVRCCLEDTKTSDKMLPKLNSISEAEDMGEMSRREAGMLKYTLMNGTSGNRNNAIFRYVMFLQDIGSDDIANKARSANAMLLEPLIDSEVDEILKARRLL